jgi:hypothetical protein
MSNSFHQVPIDQKASDLLSVATPWGLKRPRFLPEGVGPASGILQRLVRDIFADFDDWMVVIFDNFLVLADDYADAYTKLERVLDRCAEYGIVLKAKKSWIGVNEANFFGYVVSHNSWRLSNSRKEAIDAIPFPTTSKAMQRFLGAAIFFHNHVADYSEWSARLYEMTKADFVWDPGRWTYDYEAHFNKFKQALVRACTLYFPDYSLRWVLRVDASGEAVGAVLYQIFVNEAGEEVHQPIAFASKKFSIPAQKWDAFKREAFAIYYGVHSFAYYLRGKQFIVETDHRNLVWIEASQSPIVIRWRSLLQSFDFLLRHIPGRENLVADFISRAHLSTVAGVCDEPEEIPTFDEIMRSVHGGRSLHYGAAHTWRQAKQRYPTVLISIEAVREYVRNCPLCQKLRDTGVRALPEEYRTLKPTHYRRRIGMDHVTVQPDKAGNVCVLLLVEHWSHFPQAYPAKDYSADTVARVLFRHFATFGLFDEVASDPGSAFMSSVVKQLNGWLGIGHKVSLVGRHESNGCEGTSKQFLRHLTSLVHDERLADSWSDDTVLPLINFALASYPTSETGGFSPFELKYGSLDAPYFRLPDNLDSALYPHFLLQELDHNIQLVRTRSLEFQNKLAEERRNNAGVPGKYVEGDLVLWNPREQPSDYLESKLSPAFQGPFEVLGQEKNDVRCRHLNLGYEASLHVSRLKPFFGSREEGIVIARLDRDQFVITRINSYTGNAFKRESLLFNVLFDDGSTVDLPYSKDLAQSQQFRDFISSIPTLLPIRFDTLRESTAAIRALNKLAITDLAAHTTVYLNLRFYDGATNAWYDSLQLPSTTDHFVPAIVTRFLKNNLRVELSVTLFTTMHVLTLSDVTMYVTLQLPTNAIAVDDSWRISCPKLFK